jgi:lipocalin-like protein
MNRRNTLAAISVSLLLLSFALPARDAAAQSMKSVAGSYTIVSTEAFGKGARGTLMLGADGRYSILLTRATLPKFASGSRTKGTADEMKAIVDGSIAHIGKYTIDDGGKAITFHVETSTYPNWDGTTQKRALKLKGDELTYTVTAPSAGGPAADVVWKRIK